ncbi:MAG: transposase, partial [Armatimonadetes bacterium]|nr:transposase [Armatimonadota bacterium]
MAHSAGKCRGGVLPSGGQGLHSGGSSYRSAGWGAHHDGHGPPAEFVDPWLGMMGTHGTGQANAAIQESDLLLAFGMRFDDRVTGNIKTYAPRARKLHIDIDASEIHKNVRADLPIVGDLKTVLSAILPRLEQRRRPAWWARIQEWIEDTRRRDIVHRCPGGKLLAADVIHDLWKATGGSPPLLRRVTRLAMGVLSRYLKRQVGCHRSRRSAREQARPGAVVAGQTFGDSLTFHPHLHILMTDGVFMPEGDFYGLFSSPMAYPTAKNTLHRAALDWNYVFGLLAAIHLGFSDVLSALVRWAGFPVRRLFDDPLASRSLADFWSR